MELTLSEIAILIHYYTTPGDYPEMIENTAAWRCQSRKLIELGLLVTCASVGMSGQCYDTTERTRLYIETLRAVPLPVQAWVMPPPFDAVARGLTSQHEPSTREKTS